MNLFPDGLLRHMPLSVARVAELLGVSRRRALREMTHGPLVAWKRRGEVLVERSDFAAYLARPDALPLRGVL